MIYPYRESLLSQLYPGYQHSSHCLQTAVLSLETLLGLPQKQQNKVVWRLDGGFGADKHINWLLGRNYQLLAKGASARRAGKLGTQVQRWLPVRADKAVGRVPTPEDFCRPVQTFALRRQTTKGFKHAYLYSTLNLTARQTVQLYDQRGGAETEFRADKSGGLFLHKRRKHKRDPQQSWVLLTDMAHNYLAWFTQQILADSPFAGWGPLRIGRDLFRIPGYVEYDQGRLLSVKLLKSSPFAADLLDCLVRFWD